MTTDRFRLVARHQTLGRALRYGLVVLLAVAALSAFGGGYYGLSGARGVPTDWLSGSPFDDYFIPSLILLVVVGGSLLLAAVAVLAGWRSGRILALGASLIVFGWLIVQLSIIGYVSWMQPTTAVLALIIFGLGWLLPGSRPSKQLTP